MSSSSARQLLAFGFRHARHASISSKLVLQTRAFALTSPKLQSQPNQILNSIRTPPTFHTYLQQASANNCLLLLLFTTSACTPCRTITPLLTSIVQSRPSNNPLDRYSNLSFAELELDSPDTSNGNMMDMGVEWGVTSLPTLIGFGGRRADRVTDRLTDTSMLGDRGRMEEWIDEQMSKGDPFGLNGGGGDGRDQGSQAKGLWARLFG